MSFDPVFQLSALSQNDQPNPSCPGCAEGTRVWAIVTGYGGCEFLTGTVQTPYPSSNEPMDTWVHLPIPNSDTPTPTWFFKITDGIENVRIDLDVYTPGYGTTSIYLQGSNMPGWVAQNQKQDTNQIYQKGNCGIFGYAQENVTKELTYWIYTVTAGVCNPQVHPPA